MLLPTLPAAAPTSQLYQNGLGGNSSKKLVDNNVYVPKQKNNLPPYDAMAEIGGTPDSPLMVQTGNEEETAVDWSCNLVMPNIQNRTAGRAIAAPPCCRRKGTTAVGFVVTKFCQASSTARVHVPAKAPVEKKVN
ncbi:hypothetical protein MMC13_004524 [Lambiella insularis]|nr:hypothetical protein [Lambiella insularis]